MSALRCDFGNAQFIPMHSLFRVEVGRLHSCGDLDTAKQVSEKMRLCVAGFGVTERGVPKSALADLSAPHDGMVRGHRAAVKRFFVE